MTGNDLFREIGNIDEKYVTEAEETKRAVILTPAFRRTLVTAACLVVCFGLYIGVHRLDLGGQNETASMQANSNTTTESNLMMESAVMDSASEGTNAATSDMADMEDGAFWENLWPSESETAADCAPAEPEQKQESTSVDEVIQGEYEKSENSGDELVEVGIGAQEAVQEDARFWEYASDLSALPAEMVVLNEESWLQSGRESVDVFLEKVENGEEAALELVRTSDEGVSTFYYVSYDGKDYYLLTEWYYPEQKKAAETSEAIYEYLKVFEDTLEDGSVYSVIGMGENSDFTLRDLQIGTRGTLVIFRYVK